MRRHIESRGAGVTRFQAEEPLEPADVNRTAGQGGKDAKTPRARRGCEHCTRQDDLDYGARPAPERPTEALLSPAPVLFAEP